MDLYDAIFYRKSTRKYSNKKVTSGILKEVKNICEDIECLHGNEQNIKAHLIDRGHLIHFLMGKKCKVKAPHYVLITSNEQEDYLQEIGFAVEKIVLRLTGLGLATCWVESNLKREDIKEFLEVESEEAKKEKVIKEVNRVKELIKSEETEEVEVEDENSEVIEEKPQVIIAFGYPEVEEDLFRHIEADIKRETIKDISKKVDSKFTKALEAVRYSPSIENCQPWMFYNDKENIFVYEKKQKKQQRRMSRISMGVALRHFDLACKKYDIDVEYKKTEFKKRMKKSYCITIVY